MPELPEVEVTKQGLSPQIQGKTITKIIIRQPKLRYPISANLSQFLQGQQITQVSRRAKYLILHTLSGYVLIHLGMSGSLRIYTPSFADTSPHKHDHVDIIFHDHTLLRYHDPRRFGAILWGTGLPEHHHLLSSLGPEPLQHDFTPAYLQQTLKNQSRIIKSAIMDSRIVVGIGNIYANESLFQASIAPTRAANSLTTAEYQRLITSIRDILQRAITTGGSTLRDFVNTDGQRGYFQQQYAVYQRQGLPCPRCRQPIIKIKQEQRSSFYCSHCQPESRT